MTTGHDPQTRIVLSWLREDAHENPEHMLLRALDEVDATPQRRSWPAWRSNRMNTYAKLIVAAAAVLLVAVVGYQFLPGSGGVGSEPTTAPSPTIETSPSPSLLARGNFTSHGITAAIDATGSGADVAGTMALSQSGTSNSATVDLECARTTAEGLIEIGGLLTESTWDPDAQDWNDGFPTGQRVAIVFEPGSPVKAIWNVTPAGQGVTSCEAMFESLDAGGPILPGQPGLDPIQGTVEFGEAGAVASSSPTLLARGTFSAHGIDAELDATGTGADVAGTMSLSESGKGSATVDLECARTTADGLIEIGGLITNSTYEANDQTWHGGMPEGERVAIIFQPGTPVNAIWNVTAPDQGVTSCEGMFENLDASADVVSADSSGLAPIRGTVEFGP